MRQLQNINYMFPEHVSQTGITIRKGPKWDDHHTPVGTLLELRVCDGPHYNGICHTGCEHHGLAVKLGSWYGMMKDIPARLLPYDQESLYSRLEYAYAGFDEDTYVTALIYMRIAQ